MMSKLAFDYQQTLPWLNEQHRSSPTSNSDRSRYFEVNNIIAKMANDYKDLSLVNILNNFYFEKYLSKNTKRIFENESLLKAEQKNGEEIMNCSNQIQSLNNLIVDKVSLMNSAASKVEMKVDDSSQLQAIKNLLFAYETTYEEYRSFGNQTPFFLNQIMRNMIADFKEELSSKSQDNSSLSVDENMASMKAEILSLKLQLSYSKQVHADEVDALKADYEDRLRASEHQDILLNKCTADMKQEIIRNEEEIDALKSNIILFNKSLDDLGRAKAELEGKYFQLKEEHKGLLEKSIDCENKLKETQYVLIEEQKLNGKVDELKGELERVYCLQASSCKAPSADCVHPECVQLRLDFAKYERDILQNDNKEGNGQLTDSNGLGIEKDCDNHHNEILNSIDSQNGHGYGNSFDYEMDLLNVLLDGNVNEIEYGNLSIYDELRMVDFSLDSGYSAEDSDLE